MVRGMEQVLPGERWGRADCLAFSPDGTTLAVRYADFSVVLWDVATGKLRARLETQLLKAVRLAFSPDGKTLALGGVDSCVRLWDLATGKVRSTLDCRCGSITALRYAPDGRILASACIGGLVQLWKISDGQAPERLQELVHLGSVQSLAFSPDGSTLASGGTSHGIKLCDVKSGRAQGGVPTENQYIVSLEISADGLRLVAARPRGIIQIWNLADRREQATIHRNLDLDCAAISPDGRFVARGGDDGIVRVWDLEGLLSHDDSKEPKARGLDR
jgi:WD40 repeat protein